MMGPKHSRGENVIDENFVRTIKIHVEAALNTPYEEIMTIQDIEDWAFEIDPSIADPKESISSAVKAWEELIKRHASSEKVIKAASDLSAFITGTEHLVETTLAILSTLPGGQFLPDRGFGQLPKNASLGWKEMTMLTELLSAIKDEQDVRIAICIIMSGWCEYD